MLHGHARFSNVVASLSGRIGRGAGISYHEHGVDGWEVSLHRSLTGNAEPHPFTAAEVPAFTPALPAAACDCLIDLPQKSDAPAIARCFLEVYGHHYVHSEVFSTRRYWDKVESGELVAGGGARRPGRGRLAMSHSNASLERGSPNAARPSCFRLTAAIICSSA